MISKGSLDEIEHQFDGWKHQKLIVALKNLDGNLYIDCRKWLPVGSGDEMRPSKGITLSVNDWPKAILMVNEMLGRHKLIVEKPNE